MGISVNAYYEQSQENLESFKADADLRDQMERILMKFQAYGVRRMTHQLRREGFKINHKRVQRVMHQEGLCRKPKRNFHKTTDSHHPFRIYPNLAGGFKPTRVNCLWVTDITYIRIATAFVYLAAILDAFSRKVVGYALSKHIDTDLVLAALRQAIEARNPGPGCIHHSDQGVQYASHDYIKLLEWHGFKISMSRKGNPYDNAMAESFFKTLKTEEVYLMDYQTWEEVIGRIPEFIERVYNQQRIHSALGYLTPEEFELKQN